MEINRERIMRSFDEYVSDYNADDPKIRLKIDHTYRVAALAEKIAADIGADPDKAWLAGMLHDVGRFEQIKRYNTFSDAKSIDHARFGADLLFKEGLIDRFVNEPDNGPDNEPDNGRDNGLDDELDNGLYNGLGNKYARLIELVIRNHSEYRLPEELTDEEIMYCNILRDADKIDIFRVNCDTPLEDIYNVTLDELKRSGVSEEVKDCFRNRTAVLRSLKKTPADYIVGHICLFFELVYPVSIEAARSQGYLYHLLDFESQNPDTAAWFAYMKDSILTY